MNITFLNKEIKVAFNMATQIAYEKITDKPFDLSALTFAQNRIALYFAIIIANNKDTDITLDDIMNDATIDDINTIDKAVNDVMMEWYHIPATLTPEPEAEEESEEKSPND